MGINLILKVCFYMSDLDQQIKDLVQEACSHPPGSPIRQKKLTQIIRLLSGKLWKESAPYYEDALQKTWLFFCKNICDAYNPKLASVATWLNTYLKRRLQDGFIDVRDRRNQEISSWQTKDGESVDVIDTIPGQEYVEPIWEKVRAWAEEDLDGELRKIHIEGYPTVTCQVLILRRLLSETSWKTLSKEFGIPIPTLSSFYRRQCMPRLRNFGEREGYV